MLLIYSAEHGFHQGAGITFSLLLRINAKKLKQPVALRRITLLNRGQKISNTQSPYYEPPPSRKKRKSIPTRISLHSVMSAVSAGNRIATPSRLGDVA